MPTKLLFSFCFVLCMLMCTAQTLQLKDSSLTKSFQETFFRFDKVNPNRSQIWQFVAGYCVANPRNKSGIDNETLNKGVDSIMAIINRIKVTDAKSSAKATKFIDQLQDFRDSFGYNFDYKTSIDYKASQNLITCVQPFLLCKTNGFGTTCPPGSCNWFILEYYRGKINIIDDVFKLFHFLEKIDNPFKAYLLLRATMFGSSILYPENDVKIKYKKIGTKYYFIQRLRLSDCPVRNFDCLISVDNKGEVQMVDKIQFGEDDGCI